MPLCPQCSHQDSHAITPGLIPEDRQRRTRLLTLYVAPGGLGFSVGFAIGTTNSLLPWSFFSPHQEYHSVIVKIVLDGWSAVEWAWNSAQTTLADWTSRLHLTHFPTLKPLAQQKRIVCTVNSLRVRLETSRCYIGPKLTKLSCCKTALIPHGLPFCQQGCLGEPSAALPNTLGAKNWVSQHSCRSHCSLCFSTFLCWAHILHVNIHQLAVPSLFLQAACRSASERWCWLDHYHHSNHYWI